MTLVLMTDGWKEELAFERKHGRHLSAFSEIQLELELGREMAKQAKDALVQSNLGLVVSVARKFLGRGLSLPDLIQEGNMGLIKAVDRYDYSQGSRFSTYATWVDTAGHSPRPCRSWQDNSAASPCWN